MALPVQNWIDEADQNIQTLDVGSSVCVLVHGEKVAEFLLCGTVSDKRVITAAAMAHCATLRQNYVRLALGEDMVLPS